MIIQVEPESAKKLLTAFTQKSAQYQSVLDKTSLTLVNNLLAVAANEYSKLIEPDRSYRTSYLEL